MIKVFGGISGAHINPAVSIVFFLKKELSFDDLLIYLSAQIFGAISASALTRRIFVSSSTLGESLPSGSVLESFFFELGLTFILVFAIFLCIERKKLTQHLPSIIGGIVALEAFFAGPICGASMNPARSIGPALINHNTQHLWLYIIAPTLGAILALLVRHNIAKETFIFYRKQ